MAFVSLANALFLYICCILEYLYFVNSINFIFSITHFILWSRDLMVSAHVVLSILPPSLWLMKFCCRQRRGPGQSPFCTCSSLMALNTPRYESDQCPCVSECHSNTEGSVNPWSPFWIRRKETDFEGLDLSSFKTARHIKCKRGLHALLQHIPSWPLESACNVMGSVRNPEQPVLQYSVADLLCSILWQSSLFNSYSSALSRQLW